MFCKALYSRNVKPIYTRSEFAPIVNPNDSASKTNREQKIRKRAPHMKEILLTTNNK